MAITHPGPASPTVQVDTYDPILNELATDNTFTSDWPTLRQHLQTALLSIPSIFQQSATPRLITTQPSETSSSLPATSPAKSSQAAPSDSLLLSPVQASPTIPSSPASGSSPLIGPETPSHDSLDQDHDLELKPSTMGGLVLPPFPPLNPNRKRRPLVPSIAQSGPSILGASRMNGNNPHPQLVNALNAARAAASAGSAFDDEWDEDVVIGGKKLPSWLEDEEGKKEAERLGKLLEEMEYPPFTIQRLAELLLTPTAHHTTLGKFLRSIEKTLLVTTAWEPPSYTYIPPSQHASSSRTRIRSSSVTSSSSSSNYDDDNTIPPGSTTPMFSPIPFLVRPNDDISEPGDIEDRMGGSAPGGVGGSNGHGSGLNGTGDGDGAKDDGLMSPLMIGGDEGGFHFGSSLPVPRSSTPEADDKDEEDMEIEVDSPVSSTSRISTYDPLTTPSPPKYNNGSGAHKTSTSMKTPSPPSAPTSSSNSTTGINPITTPPPSQMATPLPPSGPSHQPFLGKVDELDSGPSINSTGKGEGGNMVSHGMNNHPIPISSTTDISGTKTEDERVIASLPRSTSVSSLGGLVRSGTEGDLKTLGERFVSADRDGDDHYDAVEVTVNGKDEKNGTHGEEEMVVDDDPPQEGKKDQIAIEGVDGTL